MASGSYNLFSLNRTHVYKIRGHACRWALYCQTDPFPPCRVSRGADCLLAPHLPAVIRDCRTRAPAALARCTVGCRACPPRASPATPRKWWVTSALMRLRWAAGVVMDGNRLPHRPERPVLEDHTYKQVCRSRHWRVFTLRLCISPRRPLRSAQIPRVTSGHRTS